MQLLILITILWSIYQIQEGPFQGEEIGCLFTYFRESKHFQNVKMYVLTLDVVFNFKYSKSCLVYQSVKTKKYNGGNWAENNISGKGNSLSHSSNSSMGCHDLVLYYVAWQDPNIWTKEWSHSLDMQNILTVRMHPISTSFCTGYPLRNVADNPSAGIWRIVCQCTEEKSPQMILAYLGRENTISFSLEVVRWYCSLAWPLERLFLPVEFDLFWLFSVNSTPLISQVWRSLSLNIVVCNCISEPSYLRACRPPGVARNGTSCALNTPLMWSWNHVAVGHEQHAACRHADSVHRNAGLNHRPRKANTLHSTKGTEQKQAAKPTCPPYHLEICKL